MWGKRDWKYPRCGTNMRPILVQFYKPDADDGRGVGLADGFS
jgi:hypothetical protein